MKLIQKSTLETNPNLLSDTLNLIEQSFGYQKKNKFDEDFYPLIEKGNHQNNHILICQKYKKVIGHIGVQIKTITFKNIPMPCALIGGIAIHPDYRGRGLFKSFFNNIISHYSKNTALFILWSDQFNLYEKFGFYPAGDTYQTGQKNNLDSPVLELFQKEKFEGLNQKDYAQVKELYKKGVSNFYLTFDRNDEDWEKIKKIKSADIYLLKDGQDDLLAYFFQNKGQDLPHIIHEIGFVEQYKDELIKLLSPYKLWLPVNSSIEKSDLSNFYLGLFKIGNIEILNQFLNQISQNNLKINSQNKESIEFTINNCHYQTSNKEFLQYLFGPNQPIEFEGLIPKLYISGLDSI